ncbi:MAG: hypothetical protein GQ553_03485 [Nitrosomonadaceae bacterium]|nr:hypothetical protein [Nitrosomonadaceae bacterium]
MDHKKFKIYDNNQTVQRDLIKHRKDGGVPGVYCGFDTLDPYYTMKPGETTDWTGHPTSGKTQMLLEVLLNTAELYGWKWCLYMPDVGTPVELLSDLLHKKTGKTFDKKYENVISENDIYQECPWLLEHFKVLEPLKGYKPTPKDFYELTCDLNVQGGSVDSWKDLKHIYNGPINEYLADMLTMRNSMMATANKHMHQVMHPKGQSRDKNGKFPPPTAYDISGGAAPYDSGRAMIGVNRESTETTVADIYILKAKPRIIGQKGCVPLMFDVTKSRYYEYDKHGNKRYAGPKTEQTGDQGATQQGIGWGGNDYRAPYKDSHDDDPF